MTKVANLKKKKEKSLRSDFFYFLSLFIYFDMPNGSQQGRPTLFLPMQKHAASRLAPRVICGLLLRFYSLNPAL